MKKWILTAALAAVGVSAMAGFVDERSAASAAAAAAQPAAVAPAAAMAPVGAAPARASAPGAMPSAGVVAPAPVAAAPVKMMASGPVFEVLSTDKTIREVLMRWSSSSGWTHNLVHWTLSQDYPVQGTAGADVFGAEYKTAVRALMSATESTDLPAQPCFYSNKIVRVITKSELCDRAAASE